LRIPPRARLSFATAVEPLLAAREMRTAPQVFRVLLDGAPILEKRIEVDMLGEALVWHTLELPAGGVQHAQLQFEVAGPLALTSILAPVIGPREIGTYAERPRQAPRRAPDLVVFLADTFRADNLAAYGGALGITPALDAFARRARTFTRAWSTSTHTLPAHSSIFSGVYPHENGQVDFDNPLPREVETLAELLTRAGYRCGLFSDGLMVSNAHGLDQGFATFDERREAGTLERARAFLEADDGRPIFLFAQTYAVHAPYSASAATRERLGSALELGADFETLMRSEALRSEALLPLGVEGPPTRAEDVALAKRLRDLYRAGVAELDGVFAAFLADLERHAFFTHGVLCFTSDHGESFFEHGRPFHTNWVYDTELRVPLILMGAGVTNGIEERPVSLLDLGPTWLALAGVPIPTHWRGRSLLDPDPSRVLYAFQARRGLKGTTLAVIDGSRKLIGYEDPSAVAAGKLHAAFDLAQDPGETTNLSARANWPAELERAQREKLLELLTPRFQSTRVDLTPDEQAALRGVGYVGDEADE
jgi:arylsulfatase A-like enzyme